MELLSNFAVNVNLRRYNKPPYNPSNPQQYGGGEGTAWHVLLATSWDAV